MSAVNEPAPVHHARILARETRVVRPSRLVAVSVRLHDERAGVVAGRHKNQLANNQRRGGIHRGLDSRAPTVLKIDFAVGRIDHGQTGAREEHRATFALQLGHHRRRVTGLVIECFPEQFAGVFIERNDSSPRLAADVEQHCVPLDKRRAGHAEKPVRSAVRFLRVHFPNRFAGRKVGADHDALPAHRVNPVPDNRRRGARPGGAPVAGGEARGIVVFPKRFAGLGVEALDRVVSVDLVKQDGPALGHDDPAHPSTDVSFAPQHLRPIAWPGARQCLARINPIPVRPQILRPIRRLQAKRNKTQHGQVTKKTFQQQHGEAAN